MDRGGRGLGRNERGRLDVRVLVAWLDGGLGCYPCSRRALGPASRALGTCRYPHKTHSAWADEIEAPCCTPRLKLHRSLSNDLFTQPPPGIARATIRFCSHLKGTALPRALPTTTSVPIRGGGGG